MKLRIAVGAQRERAKLFRNRGVLLLKQRWASGSRTSEPRFHDKITPIYMRAAKLRRRKFAGDPKDYYEGYFGADHVQRYKKDLLIRLRREEIASALAALPDGSVVADVGCGVGDVLSGLSRTWHRIGIDYSLQSLRLARQGSGEIAWVNGSLYDLPLGDSSADAVICLEVLEHLERDSAAVREIARALKPNGLLIVSVPDTHYFPDYLSLTGHHRHYTPATLEVLLNEAGLVIHAWLPSFPRLNAINLYVHGTLAALNVLARALFRDRQTLYDRRVPIFRVPIYSLVSRLLLEPVARRERDSWIPSRSISTFCVARKI